MDISPISTKKIYKSIIEQFVDLICCGKLDLGEKLPPERTLAEMFDVSRASIREAFSAMEIIGLIEVRPGEGAFISNLNIAPFINTVAPLFLKNENMEFELLEFRKMLEIEAAGVAAEKITKDKLITLKQPLLDMKKAIENDDTALGVKSDINFHKLIFNLTSNFILIKASECAAFMLEHSVKFNREKILKDANNSIKLNEQHIYIFEAIGKGDMELAKNAMDKHLSFVQKKNKDL